MSESTLIVSGMTCGGCVNSVTRILQDMPGVEKAVVTLLPSQAIVSYDPATVNIEQLKQAVENAGFGVQGVK